MAALSHWYAESAMARRLPEYEQPFSQSAVCRVSLEVPLGFHDI